ncbi:MAG: hypothetical protein AAF651_14405 [Cyanobacteria bacterium P01_C01_bin.73]
MSKPSLTAVVWIFAAVGLAVGGLGVFFLTVGVNWAKARVDAAEMPLLTVEELTQKDPGAKVLLEGFITADNPTEADLPFVAYIASPRYDSASDRASQRRHMPALQISVNGEKVWLAPGYPLYGAEHTRQQGSYRYRGLMVEDRLVVQGVLMAPEQPEIDGVPRVKAQSLVAGTYDDYINQAQSGIGLLRWMGFAFLGASGLVLILDRVVYVVLVR